MTKLEIEKENRALKAKVRELQKTAKVISGVGENLSDVAFGIVLIGEEKKLGIVKINFDYAKKCAIIDEASLFNGGIREVTTKARMGIVEEIIKRNKERS